MKKVILERTYHVLIPLSTFCSPFQIFASLAFTGKINDIHNFYFFVDGID